MALDIAEGRRWPIFFDGQRYMGALEAYTAALFVKLFGHTPTTVALAPLLFFGLFVAGQYLLWSRWAGRSVGHLAAILSIVCAPMAAFWTIIPRGGYVEVLAWAIPTLGVYRHLTRRDATPLAFPAQFGWGFLFAFGYFLNPLSLVVYATLALDWTFGRHGRAIREAHPGWVSVLDSPWVGAVWVGLAGLVVTTAAIGFHVDLSMSTMKVHFIYALGLVPWPGDLALGLAILGGLAGCLAWWTGAGSRVARLLSGHVAFMLGVLVALVPFPLHNLRVRLGYSPPDFSLPMWIRAPGPSVTTFATAVRRSCLCWVAIPDRSIPLSLARGSTCPPPRVRRWRPGWRG